MLSSLRSVSRRPSVWRNESSIRCASYLPALLRVNRSPAPVRSKALVKDDVALIPDGDVPDARPRRCARPAVRRARGLLLVIHSASSTRYSMCCRDVPFVDAVAEQAVCLSGPASGSTAALMQGFWLAAPRVETAIARRLRSRHTPRRPLSSSAISDAGDAPCPGGEPLLRALIFLRIFCVWDLALRRRHQLPGPPASGFFAAM